MPVPEKTANDLLVKCGRRCCICRRFEPLHLQINHIIEESEGGSDDFDNLIAVCITCHSDIHTHTKLTRRFTIEELKGHRDAVIKMVAEGKFVTSSVNEDDSIDLISKLLNSLQCGNTISDVKLPPHAVKLLLDSAQRDGKIYDESDVLTDGDARDASKLKDAINRLVYNGLLDYVSGILYRVSHEGFLLADKLIALADDAEKNDTRN